MRSILYGFLAVIGFASSVLAQEVALTADEVAKKIEADFPQVRAANVRPSPIRGVYEFTAFDGRIIYYSPAGPHIIAGAIVAPGGKNLTAERMRAIATEKVTALPLEKAVKIGAGPRKVIEVSDPDCPYCRKAADWFRERKDVTRYVFFLPLDFHPDAPAKVKAILCADGHAAVKAYEDAFSGKWDQKNVPPTCDRATGLLAEHKQIAASLGVSGTPQFWIDGEHVQGADMAKLARILDGEEVKKND